MSRLGLRELEGSGMGFPSAYTCRMPGGENENA